MRMLRAAGTLRKPLFAAGLILYAAGRVSSQTTGAANFEVASIKPNLSGNQAMLFRASPGRLQAENQTLQHLLMLAYDVKDFQISGGPGWINSDHYDVEAKAEGTATRDQMMPMLRTLLADRFKLALHRGMKELPIYELTVAKGGLKLRLSSCVNADPNNPKPLPAGQHFCGYMASGGGSLEAANASMADLAKAFSVLTGRTVVDKTGISGAFAVHLTFVPDDASSRANPADAGNPANLGDPGPSIFTAAREQLGLRLQAGKGPVEVLVIDHVEKPTSN